MIAANVVRLAGLKAAHMDCGIVSGSEKEGGGEEEGTEGSGEKREIYDTGQGNRNTHNLKKWYFNVYGLH